MCNGRDPFGLAPDVTVEGDNSKATVDYLLKNSGTFKKAYEALDADHNVHLTIRDAVGDVEQNSFPSQFVAGKNGTGLILFNATDLNQQNMDLGRASSFIFTAASVMGHEMGHAAGHWSSITGVPKGCASDPARGAGGCVIDFENRIRRDLPVSARGGIRPWY